MTTTPDPLGLPPATPEFEAAVRTFRASGGTAEQLRIFSRMAASARIRENDIYELEERCGIRDIRHLED